jgi:hypothetical protein
MDSTLQGKIVPGLVLRKCKGKKIPKNQEGSTKLSKYHHSQEIYHEKK